MPRAIWTGAISFGLVTVPVRLYSAVNRKTVRFNQLDSTDNGRIAQRRVNPRTGEEVPYDRLVKGYEIAPDSYVVITDDRRRVGATISLLELPMGEVLELSFLLTDNSDAGSAE